MAARNIPLTGPAWEPPSPTWALATTRERLRYWNRLGEIAVSVKRDEIRRGIGADGEKLEPVQPKSRPDGAAGPPLDPHFGASRTYRLLAHRHTADGATLYWRASGRKSWAEILGYHADGVVRGAYQRDTIGISPAGQRKVRARAFAFWDTIKPATARHGKPKGGRETPRPLVFPPPKPKPVRRPTVPMVAQPQPQGGA